MTSYASFSIMALICYVYLFLALAASEKTRLIRSFMLLLLAMIFWTGGSFAMRMRFGPSIRFWYDISLAGLMFLPYVFYNFTVEFIGRNRDNFRVFWLVLSTLLVIINTTTHFFLGPPRPVAIQGDIVFLYNFTTQTYLFALIFVVCCIQIALLVLRTMLHSELMRQQFLPILAGIIILVLGNSIIMLEAFKGIPLDIISGIINAILLFYVLYRRRLFNLTLLVSRGNCYALSAAITVLLFSNLVMPMRTFINRNFPLFSRYSLMLVFLLLLLATAFIYHVLKRFIDTVFIREEKQQAESLKHFSRQISKTLNVAQIAQDICTILTDTIEVSRVYVCMKDSDTNGYHILYSNAPLERQSYAIDEQNPLIQVLKRKNDGVLYRDFKRSGAYRSMWEKEKELFEQLHIHCIVPLMEQELIGMILVSHKGKTTGFTYDELNFLSSVASISTIALKNSQLYEIAYHEATSDELTGLLNRKYFYKKFLEGYEKHADGILTLILVSLDDVRLYNQLYGTREGDRAIAQAAAIMDRSLPQEACAARLGGKEFAILLPNYGLQEARKLAENMRCSIMNMNKAKEAYTLKVMTGSFGIASIPLQASNPKELEEYANQALYQAKRKGKNQVVLYNETSSQTLKKKGEELQDRISIYSGYESTIAALTAAIDTKDHYTFTHSKHVAYYALKLAYAIGLQEDVVEIIREAALLHDIGKIGIREDILNKQGALSDEEYEIMKGHVENSIGIIRYLPSLDYVIPAVITHHERWDGHGYPRRIAKEDIPLAGRILCIADSFDAMTSNRSYRHAKDIHYAITELKKEAGRQFDPKLCEVFIRLLETQEIELQQEVFEKDKSIRKKEAG